MDQTFQALLDLRRDAEEAARLALERATAARGAEEEELARLVARMQKARAALIRQEKHRSPAPKTAARALTRQRYEERLREDFTRAELDVETRLEVVVAAARNTESEAQAAYEQARVALEAVLKHQERVEAEAAKLAERRAEEAVSDHVSAVRARPCSRTP